MSSLSRRSFIAIAGTSGLALSTSALAENARPHTGHFGVRTLYMGWSWMPTLWSFYCLEVQEADGTWRTIPRPYVRLALMPDDYGEHIKTGERATFSGPLSLQKREAWHTTTITNCRGHELQHDTSLIPSFIAYPRIRQVRAYARERGLNLRDVRHEIVAAMQSLAA